MQLEYLNRIDPSVTYEQALRLLEGVEMRMPRLRPKARKEAEEKLAMILRDIEKLRLAH